MASPFSSSLCAFVGTWFCHPSSDLSHSEEKVDSRRRPNHDLPNPLGAFMWALGQSETRIAFGNCRGQQLNFCFSRVLLHSSTVELLINVGAGGFTRFPRTLTKMALKLFPTWNCLKKRTVIQWKVEKQLLKQCRLQILWGMDPLQKRLDSAMIQVSNKTAHFYSFSVIVHKNDINSVVFNTSDFCIRGIGNFQRKATYRRKAT